MINDCASTTEKGVYWYMYCLNNPLKYTDPTGQLFVLDDYGLDKLTGKITHLRDTYDNFDRLIALDEAGKETNKSIKVYDKNILPELAKRREGWGKTIYAKSESSEIGDVFLFAAQNSIVEWGFDGYRNNGRNEYVVYTDRSTKGISPSKNWHMFRDATPLFDIHSHFTTNMDFRKASGYNPGDLGNSDYSTITNSYYSNGNKVPNSYIYHPYSESLIKYTPWNPQENIKTGVTYPGGLLFLYKK